MLGRPDHPQRLAPAAAPGELLKGTAPVMVPRVRNGSDPSYLAMIRELPCLSCGMEPCGEAAHVRLHSAAYGKTASMAVKPADKWAVPLCGSCHREDRAALHRIGEHIFWLDLGINPLLACANLFAARGDLVRMRAIVLMAIANRHGVAGQCRA